MLIKKFPCAASREAFQKRNRRGNDAAAIRTGPKKPV